MIDKRSEIRKEAQTKHKTGKETRKESVTMKQFGKNFVRLVALLMMAVMLSTVVGPMDAQAASPKKVTIKADFKKAPALKVGSNKVTYTPSKAGFMKITFPSNGKYVLTFSNIVSNDRIDNSYGNISFFTRERYAYNNKEYLKSIGKVKTEGGKASTLQMTTKTNWNKYDKNRKQTATSSRATRSATISVKAGTTIYIRAYFASSGTKVTGDLSIKKKK